MPELTSEMIVSGGDLKEYAFGCKEIERGKAHSHKHTFAAGTEVGHFERNIGFNFEPYFGLREETRKSFTCHGSLCFCFSL